MVGQQLGEWLTDARTDDSCSAESHRPVSGGLWHALLDGPAKTGSARDRIRKLARTDGAGTGTGAGRRADWNAPGTGARAPAAPPPPGAKPGTRSARAAAAPAAGAVGAEAGAGCAPRPR